MSLCNPKCEATKLGISFQVTKVTNRAVRPRPRMRNGSMESHVTRRHESTKGIKIVDTELEIHARCVTPSAPGHTVHSRLPAAAVFHLS